MAEVVRAGGSSRTAGANVPYPPAYPAGVMCSKSAAIRSSAIVPLGWNHWQYDPGGDVSTGAMWSYGLTAARQADATAAAPGYSR